MGERTEITVRAYRILSSTDRDSAARISMDLARRAAAKRGRAGRLDVDEIEDVEGEILAVLWGRSGSALADANADSPLLAWMLGVCDHKVADRIRQNVRHRGARDADAVLAAKCASRAKSRVVRWSQFDEGDRSALSDRQRRAIELHVVGRTHASIASELEVGLYRAIELVRVAWRRLRLAHAHLLVPLHPLLPSEGWARLNPRQRRIAALWNGGRSRHEIGRIEGVTPDSVRGVVSRVRTLLHQTDLLGTEDGSVGSA